MICDRFYYSILSDKEKAVYKKIYNCILKFDKTVAFTTEECHGISLAKIYQYVELDNPHFFYVDFVRIQMLKHPLCIEVSVSYLHTVKEIQALQNKVDAALRKIIKRVSGNSDYEKELSVHNLLIENVLYDSVALKNLCKHSLLSNNILGVLLYKSAVCGGIAKTVKILLNLLGIKCIVAVGKNKTSGEGHAWNIVKIEGKPYHLDVTNDLCKGINDSLRFDYYNATDIDMLKNMAWDIDYPKCDSTKYNYFVQNDLIASSVKEAEKIVYSSLREGKRIICVKCTFEITNSEVSRIEKAAYTQSGCNLKSLNASINTSQNIFTLSYK